MSDLLLRTRGLCRRFGARTALHPLDLDLDAGRMLAVLGPNGAGKTTLLRLVAGVMRPSAGEVQLRDPRASARLDPAGRRACTGLVGHAPFVYDALSARENLEFAARLYGLKDARARAARMLKDFELEAAAERPVRELSHGLTRRLGIARALVHDPPLLLLDEPFSGLDPQAADRLAERLQKLVQAGRSLLLVTHDPARAAAADSALALVRGRARPLPAEALQTPRKLLAAYSEATAALEAGA